MKFRVEVLAEVPHFHLIFAKPKPHLVVIFYFQRKNKFCHAYFEVLISSWWKDEEVVFWCKLGLIRQVRRKLQEKVRMLRASWPRSAQESAEESLVRARKADQILIFSCANCFSNLEDSPAPGATPTRKASVGPSSTPRSASLL